jgi:hypothetical protein
MCYGRQRSSKQFFYVQKLTLKQTIKLHGQNRLETGVNKLGHGEAGLTNFFTHVINIRRY